MPILEIGCEGERETECGVVAAVKVTNHGRMQ
jgi:hypothetical protein